MTYRIAEDDQPVRGQLSRRAIRVAVCRWLLVAERMS